MRRIADIIDSGIRRFGAVAGWAAVLLMILIVVQVILTNFTDFTHLSVIAFELQLHLYAAMVLGGVAYAHVTNSQVRVDLLASRIPRRARHIIELLGVLFIMLPFYGLLFVYSLPFVHDSFAIKESSDAPGGLPYLWVVKSFIPIGCVLVYLAGVSTFLRTIHRLRHADDETDDGEPGEKHGGLQAPDLVIGDKPGPVTEDRQ
ncbi:MAG: TRAP transporter small permease subunit [Lentisphaeria bacterium]|nr:TRAP transporter small permease subunit [Lentisphaeria bacterium]MDP7740262.1 TRAP transporter small permease subunit [Lentisphaeria bacterium]